MPRARKGAARRRAKRRLFKRAEGYYGGKSRLYRTVKEAVRRAGVYAYRDRKARKRSFRRLWITRISAGCRPLGLNYSRLMKGLKKAEVHLNTKILADLAVADQMAFQELCETAKRHL